MASYACAKCGAATARGSIIGYGDGSFIAIALCPLHKDILRKRMEEDGVPVTDASRPN